MKISKKSLFLFFTMISALSGRAATNDTTELNQQMKHFFGRVRVYSKCIRGTCSPEERAAAADTVLRDGRNMVLAIGALLGSGLLLKKYALPALAKNLEERSKKATRQKKKMSKRAKIISSPAIEHAKIGFETEINKSKQNNPGFLGYEIESKIGGKSYTSERYKGDPAYTAFCIIPIDYNNWIIVKVFYKESIQASTFMKRQINDVLDTLNVGELSMGTLGKKDFQNRDTVLKEEHFDVENKV